MILLSCEKDMHVIKAIQTIDIGPDVRINDLYFGDDSTWHACGGIRNEAGYIFRSSDAGKNWSEYKAAYEKSIYCIDFLSPDTALAGGDFLHLWQTTDGGLTWNLYWLADQVPFNGEDRPAVRQIYMAGVDDWYFCGGENLGEGVIYETHDAGAHWNFVFFQNELRTITRNGDDALVTAGHGATFSFHDSLSGIVRSEFKNDFMTSVLHLDNGTCIGVSYDGSIYRSDEDALVWSKVTDSNRVFAQRVNWNRIKKNNGHILIAGNNGCIAESDDDGHTWYYSQLEGRQNLYSIAFSGSQAWVGSDGGELYRIQ